MGTLKKIRHRDAFRIGICFDYDGQLKQSTQRIGTRWSQTLQWWCVDSKSESFKKIKPNSPKLKSSSPKLKTTSPKPKPTSSKIRPTSPKLEPTFPKLKPTFPKIKIAKDPNQEISHPVYGLQNSHDTVPIVNANIASDLLSPLGEELKFEKPEPAVNGAEFLYIPGKYWVVKVPYGEKKTTKSDNFMMFTN